MAHKSTKKKIKKVIPSGVAHIKATFNNTIICITDELEKALVWSSAGAIGFKGTKKSTPYVAQLISEQVGKAALNFGMKKIRVEIKGPGSGRDAAVRSLQAVGLEITSIKDVTPIPHNGVRPPKKPRK